MIAPGLLPPLMSNHFCLVCKVGTKGVLFSTEGSQLGDIMVRSDIGLVHYICQRPSADLPRMHVVGRHAYPTYWAINRCTFQNKDGQGNESICAGRARRYFNDDGFEEKVSQHWSSQFNRDALHNPHNLSMDLQPALSALA